eukprot:4972625-Amphidinium_carterae.1
MVFASPCCCVALQIFAGHANSVTCGCWAMGGKLICTGSADCGVIVHGTVSSLLVLTIPPFSITGRSKIFLN